MGWGCGSAALIVGLVVKVGTPLGRPVALTGDPLLISSWEGEGWLLEGEGTQLGAFTVAM